jgi:sodium/proline symporter
LILFVFLLYLLLLACIGIYYTRANRVLEDFVLGGRRLGPWVTAVSAEASDMSGWLLIGLPAAAFAGGFSILWAVVGCAAGTLFNWVVIAPRLHRAAERAGALTIPDFLEARFFGHGGILIRIVAVAIILVFYATYISAQFTAAGKIFETTFSGVSTPWGEISVDYVQGILIGCGVIMFYTISGGFLAVAMTDLVQGMIMAFAVVVIPAVGIWQLGGLDGLWNAMAHAREGEVLLRLGGEQKGLGFLLGVAAGGLSWGLGYPGQPHILVRFMAIKEAGKIKFAALISVCWVLAALYGAMFVGFVGRALHPGGLEDPDSVFPLLATHLLPDWLAGVMIAAAIAAVMSTVDSQILVAVSAVVSDVYGKLLGGEVRSSRGVWLGRLTGVLLGGAAFLLALQRRGVFEQVFDAWGGLAAGLGPAVCFSLLWPRTTYQGVLGGMLVGSALTQLWPALVEFLPYRVVTVWPGALIPSFGLSCLTLWAVSLLTLPNKGDSATGKAG